MLAPILEIDRFWAGVLTLASYEGSFAAEIIHGGIQGVDKGQYEAADAIGMSKADKYRYIIFPQAIRKILPPLAGQFITLIKDSAIVSLISIQEPTFPATEQAATTTKVFETWIVVGAMDFVLCYSLAVTFGSLVKRAAKGRR